MDTAALHRFHKRAKIAVAREQHHLIDMLGELHGIHCEFDVHVALDLSTAVRVDEFLRGLGDDGKAIIIQPIDQGPDRRVFLIFDNRRVVEGPNQSPTALKIRKQRL